MQAVRAIGRPLKASVPLRASKFDAVEMAPPDPILGVSGKYWRTSRLRCYLETKAQASLALHC